MILTIYKHSLIMDEMRKQLLSGRLSEIGHNGLGLSESRWAQLLAVDMAAQAMLAERRKAVECLKDNKLTVANLERKFKEMASELEEAGASGFTDQTARNGDGLLERFFFSYLKDDVVIPASGKDVVELRNVIKVLRDRIAKMALRDGEIEEWKIKYDNLMKDYTYTADDLKAEKARSKVLEGQLRKVSVHRTPSQLVIPEPDD